MADHRLLEHPARHCEGLAGGIAALTAVALLTLSTGGFPIRLDAEARDLLARMNAASGHHAACRNPALNYIANPGMFALCGSEATRRYLLAGDSHAAMSAPALTSQIAEHGFLGFVATLIEIMLGSRTAKKNNQAACTILPNDILRLVQQEKIDVVILSSSWAKVASPVRAPYDGGRPKGTYDAAAGTPISFADALDHTIWAIRAAGAKVLLVGPVPELNFDVPSAVLRRAQIGIPVPKTRRADVDLRQSTVRSAMAAIGAADGVSVIQPDDTLCDTSTCADAKNGLPLYEDSNHLNAIGAELITAPITDAVVKILGRRVAEAGR